MTSSRTAGRRVALVALLAAALAFGGAAWNATPARAATGDRTFVGVVSGTDAFIAITVDRAGRVAAYLCDGKIGRRAKTYGWFRGRSRDARFEKLARGMRLVVRLGRAAITGTLRLADGRVRRFTARPARGKAGLFRLTRPEAGTWIILNDGRVRGRTVSDPCKSLTNKYQQLKHKFESGATWTRQDQMDFEATLILLDGC